MKVAIINNDFRVYWRSRLDYLQKYLSSQKISFYAIELFGKGSPYSFDTHNDNNTWFTCLFPHNSSEELSGKDIKKVLFPALDKIKPDIVITASIVFYSGALGMRWAKKNKKKIITFDDAKPVQVKRKPLVQWIKNLIIKQSDGLWFPSKDYYEEYRVFHHRGIHFFYGYNCINNGRFKCAFKQESNSKTFLCVARLVPVKNIDNLLRSWQFIEERKTGYKLIIIGNGPWFEHLTNLQLSLNLNTVEFHGAIDHTLISDCYCNAEVFILPSFSESWGLVVNEAMAAGLPVLLSDKINAAKTLLKEGINGFNFDPQSISSISEAILKYIDADCETKRAMSVNSLQIIDTMSFEKMGSQLLDALLKIKTQKYKHPGFLAGTLINAWYGRYTKTGWNSV